MSDDGKVTSAGPQHAAEAEPTRSSDLAPPTPNLFYSGNGASSLIYSGNDASSVIYSGNGASSVIYSGDGAGSVPLSGGGSAIDVGDGEQPVGVPAIISHGIPSVSSNSLYPSGSSVILSPDMRSSVSSGSVGIHIHAGIRAGNVKSAPKIVAGPYVSPSRQRYLAAAKARAGHITSASACVPHVATGYSEGLVVTKSPLSSSDGSAGGGASGGVGYISYSGGVPAGSVTSAAAELQENFGAQLQQLQVDFEQRIHAIQVELQAQLEVKVRAEIQRIRSGVDEQIRAFGGTIQMWSKSASGVEGQIVALRGTLQKLSEASSENVTIRSELWDDVGRLLDTTEALSLTMQKTDDKMARELSPAVTKLTSAVNKLEHWRSVTHSKVSQLEHQVTMVDNRIYGLEQFFGYS